MNDCLVPLVTLKCVRCIRCYLFPHLMLSSLIMDTSTSPTAAFQIPALIPRCHPNCALTSFLLLYTRITPVSVENDQRTIVSLLFLSSQIIPGLVPLGPAAVYVRLLWITMSTSRISGILHNILALLASTSSVLIRISTCLLSASASGNACSTESDIRVRRYATGSNPEFKI